MSGWLIRAETSALMNVWWCGLFFSFLLCSQAFFKFSHSKNINTGVLKMGLILLDEAVVSVLFQVAAGLSWWEGLAQENAPDRSL